MRLLRLCGIFLVSDRGRVQTSRKRYSITDFRATGSKKKEVSAARRRGALMVLSYFAKAKRNIIADNLENLLRVGLGEYGKVGIRTECLLCR